jgi:hypothetical protein
MDLGKAEDPELDPVYPRARQGIEFVAHDDSNGELRITGDDAGLSGYESCS